MKKIIFSITILFWCILSFGQTVSEYTQIITNDSNEYRFQKVTVYSYDELSDTVRQPFPGYWLDSASMVSFHKNLIVQQYQRQEELRRLFVDERNSVQANIDLYDSLNGAGAFMDYQKETILQSIQGEWRLVDRVNGDDPVVRDITITGNRFILNANKEGSILITDDLEVFLTGFYPFDLTFRHPQSGVWRSDRGKRIFVLRR